MMELLGGDGMQYDGGKRKWYQLDSRGITNLIVVCAGILLYLGLTHFTQVRNAVRGFVDVLSPFILGFVIAYLLNTPIDFFEEKVFKKLKAKRTLSIITVYFMAIAIICILLQLIIPQVLDSLRQLLSNLTSYLANLSQMAQDLIQRFHLEGEGLTNLVDHYNELIASFSSADIVKRATGFLTTSASEILNFGVSVGNNVVNGVVTVLTALIASIYMLAGKARLLRQLKKLIYAFFPANSVDRILSVSSNANRIFVGFINGKILDSAIIGVLCFVFTSILKVPYAILISVIVGVTNVIPFFGPIIGAVPCIMILIMIDFWAALRFAVLVVVLQQFDGNILGPKILGNSTGLSALWVLVAIIVGGGLFGFPGMVLGVPTFAVLYSLLREWTNARLQRMGIDEEGTPLDEDGILAGVGDQNLL